MTLRTCPRCGSPRADRFCSSCGRGLAPERSSTSAGRWILLAVALLAVVGLLAPVAARRLGLPATPVITAS